MSATKAERTLLLLRHAKAEHGHGKPDHDRELAARGRRDARAVGEWLHRSWKAVQLPAGPLDLVLCSTSERTRQTLEAVCAGGASVKETHFDERIYDAGAAGLLHVLREVPDSVNTVLLIGHAPGIPVLATALALKATLPTDSGSTGSESTGSGSTAGAVERLSQGFPTSGLAVLGFGGRWSSLAPDAAYLREFVVPRG